MRLRLQALQRYSTYMFKGFSLYSVPNEQSPNTLRVLQAGLSLG
jgi:hypothetical protein